MKIIHELLQTRSFYLELAGLTDTSYIGGYRHSHSVRSMLLVEPQGKDQPGTGRFAVTHSKLIEPKKLEARRNHDPPRKGEQRESSLFPLVPRSPCQCPRASQSILRTRGRECIYHQHRYYRGNLKFREDLTRNFSPFT